MYVLAEWTNAGHWTVVKWYVEWSEVKPLPQYNSDNVHYNTLTGTADRTDS